MLLLKQILDHLRLLLTPMQMTAHGTHEFSPVSRPALAETIGLDILVEEFVRVKLRAVARHPDEPQPRRVLFHQAPNLAGPVDRMPVHNQIDPARELLEQSRQEAHEDRGLELARKHHEGQRPLVGNGRDHVAAEALAGGSNHRRLSHRGIGRARHVVTAQSHLIPPVNHGLFTSCLPGDRRALPRQPLRDGRLVALVGTLDRLLRTQAPALEVTSHGDERHLDPVFARNQARHGGARPQIKRQLQLIGHLADNHRADASGLSDVQPPRTRSATPALELERAQAAVAVEAHPFAHGPQTRAKRGRGFGLCHSGTYRLHHLSAQQALRRGVQLPRIDLFVHASYV